MPEHHATHGQRGPFDQIASANLPYPHVIAEEIAEDLRDALERIESVRAYLKARAW